MTNVIPIRPEKQAPKRSIYDAWLQEKLARELETELREDAFLRSLDPKIRDRILESF